MKKIIISLLVIFILIFSGCSKDTTINDVVDGVSKVNDVVNNYTQQNPNNPNKVNIDMTGNNVNSIKIASFNIQNLGEAKLTDGRIVDIVDVVDDFDIIAIQEVSNLYEMTDPNCNRNINAPSHENFRLVENGFRTNLNDSKWGIKISPYISDERYMFVYDTTKVDIANCKVVKDNNDGQLCEKSGDNDLMNREAFVCEFIVGGKEDVYLMTAHTTPSENFRELLGLKIFYDEYIGQDDIILLGDLNYDGDYIRDGTPFQGYNMITYEDTTVADSVNGYDVFIYDTNNIIPTGEKGVVKVPKRISDHYLIWSEWKLIN